MIYTIGETVLDIIINTMQTVQMRPGGSMLNTAISLGRLNIPVSHISLIANDKASEMLLSFFEENGVATNWLHRETGMKTSLALAFLDENRNADYSFYKEELTKTPDFFFPDVSPLDIVHFGSFFSLNPILHKPLHEFLINARKNGALILYDPNFRSPHLPQLHKLMPMIEANLSVAQIVKASNDDLENIFKVRTPIDAWKIINRYSVEILVYTMGANGSWVFTAEESLFVPSIKIELLSTIGAGDTFSAGIIFYMYKMMEQGIKYHQFSRAQWEKCLELATVFAAETCQSYDNYLSCSFAKKYPYVR